jgi:hypothetical protein
VFWKSDRRGRSAGHVLGTIGELRDRGVTARSLTENFDLSAKEGRFMFAVLAAAEYELELRAGRQAEGIAAARRRQADGTMLPGKKRIGRPRAVGPAELAQLQQMTGEGATVTQVARILKISAPPPTPPSGSTRRRVLPSCRYARIPRPGPGGYAEISGAAGAPRTGRQQRRSPNHAGAGGHHPPSLPG